MRARMGAMSYKVLARKLRPADFHGLVGQDHIVRALRHGLDAGRLHHAYLFTGTRGVGKTTIARILARCLNCEQGVGAAPCGECGICREVQENRFVDLIEVDAASRTRVDDTRELLENAQYLPARGRYKIYLIDEVHMLSTSSFNALLKTLEEPPEHVKFLLATTNPKKVPITVLSRCLQFQLKSISRERIAAYLAAAMTDEGIAFEQDALDLIGKSARGSMRDALSITDQAIAFGQGELKAADVAELLGAVGRDEVAAIIAAVQTGRPGAVLEASHALAERGADFEAVLAELLQALHDVAVAKALQEDDAYPGLSVEAVQLHYQIALLGYRDLRVGPDAKTAFEMTLLRMLAFAPDADGAARVPAAQGGAPAESPSAPASIAAPAKDAAPVRPRSEQPAPPVPDAPCEDGAAAREALAAEWCELVSRLELQGLGKAIVERAILLEKGAGLFRLRLDQAHHAMLKAEQSAAIERALSAALGRSIRVQVEQGVLDAECPAVRQERLEAERNAAARRQFAQDSLVRTLLNQFGGQVLEAKYLESH